MPDLWLLDLFCPIKKKIQKIHTPLYFTALFLTFTCTVIVPFLSKHRTLKRVVSSLQLCKNTCILLGFAQTVFKKKNTCKTNLFLHILFIEIKKMNNEDNKFFALNLLNLFTIHEFTDETTTLTEEKVNAEMQRLRRELREEQEKVQRLSSQLSTNVSSS